MLASHDQKFYGRQDKCQRNDNLHDQDGRHSVDEVPVPCLVTEELHARDRADAAADNGQHKQRGFRNPPDMLDCPAFINTHSHKAD